MAFQQTLIHYFLGPFYPGFALEIFLELLNKEMHFKGVIY